VRRDLCRALKYVPCFVEVVAGIEQALYVHVVAGPDLDFVKAARVGITRASSVSSSVQGSRIR